MTEGTPTRWRGLNKNGEARMGQGVPDNNIGVFVENAFNHGWRSMTVTRGDEEVAGIDRRTDNGRRVWWALS